MIVRVVTGAAGFLGRALAAHLAELPGRILAVDTTAPSAPDPQRPAITAVDCRSEAFAEQLRQSLRGTHRAELYEATGTVAPLAHIAGTSLDDFGRAVTANLEPAYAAARAFADIAAHYALPASMTFLGSIGGAKAHRYQVGYDAAKAGLESLVRSFALEYGPVGVTARVVEVGPIAESPSTGDDGARLRALTDLVPLGRYPTLTEVVQAVAAFGAAEFDLANGAALPLDGGLVQQLRPAAIERPPGG